MSDIPEVIKSAESVTGTLVGRPKFEYNQETADVICELLALGWSMRSVIAKGAAETGVIMPSIATVFKWMRENEEFLKQYTRAKQEAADAMAEEILDISDDGTNDWIEQNGDENAKERYSLNGEHIARSRLRVESRKWLMAKMKPKKYGDKMDIDTKIEMVIPILGAASKQVTEDSDE